MMLQYWEVSVDGEEQPLVSFVSSSPVNAKCTNCVRFSPTGVHSNFMQSKNGISME